MLRYSRPSKPGYNIEMYRIVFIRSGRASEEVAAASLAPHMGPRKRHTGSPLGLSGTTSPGGRPRQSEAEVGSTAGRGKADKELVFGVGGWVYAYGYEEDLEHCELLGREPRIKVGYTGGDYVQRINTQTRGTGVPDVPRILRAYQVGNPSLIEAEVHRRLKAAGRHHRRAGGSEWFRLTVEVLDGVVLEVVHATPSASLPD